MKKNTLIIFIDGLQFDESQRIDPISRNASTPVKPSIGFSNNIYPEMFCGKNPDSVGYFNEWSPVPRPEKSFADRILKPFDFLRKYKYVNAVFRIIVLKKFFRKFVGNIPFKYVHLFSPSGAHDFGSFKDESLLGVHNFEIFDAALCKKSRLKKNKRDLEIVEEIFKSDLSGKNVLLSLMELDNISHTCGMWSAQYEKHLKFLESSLNQLIEKYLDENPGGDIFLFSDHGMTPVEKGVELNLEEQFGDMSENTYQYFLDSTFLRIWCKDEVLREKIKLFLDEQPSGEIISESERSLYGVTNREFGDIIFRANEGIMFLPNFFGIRLVKAMHGYDSELKSQKAVFANLGSNDDEPASLPTSSMGIFEFLKARLQA